MQPSLSETAPHAQAEPTSQSSHPSNASRSSGEGVWGRGASLREAASPSGCFTICPSPNAASPRRLCQPPWTQPSLSETAPHSQAEPTSQSSHSSNARRSSGEGVGGEALLSEKRPLPQSTLPFFLVNSYAEAGDLGGGVGVEGAPSGGDVVRFGTDWWRSARRDSPECDRDERAAPHRQGESPIGAMPTACVIWRTSVARSLLSRTVPTYHACPLPYAFSTITGRKGSPSNAAEASAVPVVGVGSFLPNRAGKRDDRSAIAASAAYSGSDK